MDLIVYPGRSLRGETTLPGDKSLSHRTALFAALADGESVIDGFLVAGVTRTMLRALSALDVAWKLDDDRLMVTGLGLSSLRPPTMPLDCGHSATTIRILAGALAAAGLPAVLDGSPELRTRPMDRVVQPLRAMGVSIENTPSGGAPLILGGRPHGQQLRSLTYRMPVASAQVKTALLLAGLAAEGPVTLVEPGPSRDHTERLLVSMGVPIHWMPFDNRPQFQNEGMPSSTVTLTPPDAPLSPLHLTLPGDFSSAAFLIVAGLITPGSQLKLQEVGLNPTRTGLLDALARMGADIQVQITGVRHGEPVGDLLVHHTALQATEIDGMLVVRMIDEFPAFAVAAAYADGTTRVRQAEELRYKESDRIAAICRGLQALGVGVNEVPDGFDVQGGRPPAGGNVQSDNDHRMALAWTVAGLGAWTPVTVENAEILTQSFPGFVDILLRLGAGIRMVNGR